MTAHPLDADVLLARGRAIAGPTVEQVVDHAADEPFRVLVDSVNAESELHELGAEGMTNKLCRIVANRLRMVRDFEAHPEIHDEVVRAPLIIIGMPRTGSTKTQKVFAASGDFNYLPMWQTSYPSLFTGDPAESPQPRIDGGLEYEAWLELASPDMKYCHQFLATEPEEDSWILEHSLVSPVFLGFSPVGSYVQWMIKQGVDPQFEHLRDTLKYLQWQGVADRTKRWVLKCPMYYGLEPAVMRSFPDATLLMTHRTPIEAVASGSKMLELFHQCFSDAAPDIEGYYRGAQSGLRRHMKNRAADANLPVVDVHYRDMIDDVATVAAQVYEFADEPLSAESIARMQQWDRDHPKDAHGKHVYSLEQYGFERGQMEDDFGDYLGFMEAKTGRR